MRGIKQWTLRQS